MANTWTTLLDAVCPVGSVYISYSTTSPATRFGGTWSAITGFPWLHASTTPGTTGGEEKHLLSSGEIPYTSGWVGLRGTANSFMSGDSISSGCCSLISYTNSCWNFGYDSSGLKSGYASFKIEFGNSESHNNLPPYYVLRGWRRTA